MDPFTEELLPRGLTSWPLLALAGRPPASGPSPPTFQPLLPERHHLVELPLDQPIHLLLIQPVAAREGLLNAREGAQNHHLAGRKIMSPLQQVPWLGPPYSV